MSEFRRHAEDYLRLRRSLGFKLTLHGPLLAQFVDYLDAAQATSVTTELAVRFAQLPQRVQPIVWAQRLSMVRGFARYLQAVDPGTEVPPFHVFAPHYQRPTPYLWQETEMLDLMAQARKLRPALCALTYEALFGLLWSSGMRIGETINLQKGDVDLTDGVITVRQAKLGRTRLVPLQRNSVDALASYRRQPEPAVSPPAVAGLLPLQPRRHLDPPGCGADLPSPRRQDRPAHRDEKASRP